MRDLGLLPADEPAWEPDPKPPSQPAAVVFTGIQADGGGLYSTTALTLHFSAGIAGLTADDITLAPSGVITKKTLEGAGPSYTLYVDGITAEGDVGVSVNKAGYAFKPTTKTATVLDGNGPVPGASDNASIKAKFGVTETGTNGVAATFNALHAFIQGGGLSNQPNMIHLGDYDGRLRSRILCPLGHGLSHEPAPCGAGSWGLSRRLPGGCFKTSRFETGARSTAGNRHT